MASQKAAEESDHRVDRASYSTKGVGTIDKTGKHTDFASQDNLKEVLDGFLNVKKRNKL